METKLIKLLLQCRKSCRLNTKISVILLKKVKKYFLDNCFTHRFCYYAFCMTHLSLCSLSLINKLNYLLLDYLYTSDYIIVT